MLVIFYVCKVKAFIENDKKAELSQISAVFAKKGINKERKEKRGEKRRDRISRSDSTNEPGSSLVLPQEERKRQAERAWLLGHQTDAQKYRRNQAAVRLRRREKKREFWFEVRGGRGRSWRTRKTGRQCRGAQKKNFACLIT